MAVAPTCPDAVLPGFDLGNLAVAQFVHDVRNHLTVISTCAERAADLVPRGQAGRELADIRRSAERASLLARDLLTAARPGDPARGVVDLNQAVIASSGIVSSLLGDTIRLHMRLASGRLPVSAELFEIERIVLNLSLNSRDAMPAGGVLTIETSWVERAPGTSLAQLVVRDTGPGIQPDVQARMLEPFFTTREEGTGLGLSSVALTVRQLEGTLSIDSAPGRGTSVTVQLPSAR